MKRFKSILVVCQEDAQPELAVERARILAQQNGAKVALVDVINMRENELMSIGSSSPDGQGNLLRNRIVEYHRSRLSRFGRRLRDQGIETTETILWGVNFVEIIRTVLREDHDLVVKAVNPVRFNDQRILGSLDMHLMRKCPCPVWILKDRFEQENLRVLAAVDPVGSHREPEDLNRQILELSASFCAAEAGHLHIVNAWSLDEERALVQSGADELSDDEISQIREQIRVLRSQALERLISSHPVAREGSTVHLVHGEAGDVVTSIAVENHMDLIVMGTVNHTDVPGLFMGNTAEVILSRANCSVLGVKPRGFRTPIELGDPSLESGEAAGQSVDFARSA